MNNSGLYKPSIFRIIVESCHSTEFYSRIKDISLARSTGFLLLLSLLVSLISFALFFNYLANQEDKSTAILNYYDKYAPNFELMLTDNKLQSSPDNFVYYFNLNDRQQLETETEKNENTIFMLQIDTTKTRAEFGELPLSGIYVLKDSLLFHTGLQKTVIEYSSLGIPVNVSYSKETIRPVLVENLPHVLKWAKRIILQIGTGVVFFYTFISSWFLAVFASIFGMLVILIRQKKISYSFLLKLSFFATVPALFIALITYLLAIGVPFLPFLVYLGFYYYGLMVYEEELIA